ncbi:MAG: AraC family transcriptional regulator [Verrucomicrobiota bacterium]
MKAVQMMLSDPGNFPSIGSLAASLEMSIRNFDRRFKEDTGFTPKQFLGRARVRRACQLLQESDASISELALELGFCDQSAFTAQFRIRMGMTPLKYRKQFGHFSLGGPI